MLWKVFYSDLTTFSDEDGTPDEVPALDVQVIAVAHPIVGVRLWATKDYYWYVDDTWIGGDSFGLWDYLSRPGYKKVLFGRTISDERYAEVFALSAQETANPVKHGWLDSEHAIEGLK